MTRLGGAARVWNGRWMLCSRSSGIRRCGGRTSLTWAEACLGAGIAEGLEFGALVLRYVIGLRGGGAGVRVTGRPGFGRRWALGSDLWTDLLRFDRPLRRVAYDLAGNGLMGAARACLTGAAERESLIVALWSLLPGATSRDCYFVTDCAECDCRFRCALSL